jgi:hypothetical protein
MDSFPAADYEREPRLCETLPYRISPQYRDWFHKILRRYFMRFNSRIVVQ